MSGRILQGPKLHSCIEKTSLGQFFFNMSEKYKDNICQIDADFDKSESYFHVNQRSVRLAIRLQSKGITSRDLIASSSRSALNVIPIIAACYVGAKIVNFDPTLSVKKIEEIMGLLSPKIVFVEEPSISLIEESLKDVPHKPEIIVFEESQKYSSLSDMMKPHPSEEEFRPVQTNIHETAIMLLTSGTSGQSKVVCHSHYSILRMLDVLNQCGHRAKSVLHLNIFQWLSALMTFTLTFLEGGTRVFCHKMDGEFFLKIIEKYKPTALYLPPNYSYDLTRIQDAKKYDVSSLNCIATGSTPLSTKQFRRMDDLFGNATILFGYGMTELGRIASFNLETDKHLIKSKTASCGKIVPGTGVKVVNPDTNEILGPNQKGEIWVKSPSTMRGYFKREDSDCFDDDGFLRTEDVGYYDEDECFYVVGRITQMIKYQSSYIQPYSIEAVLMEHPAVTDAAVFGIPQGEEQVPAACIVLNSDVSAQEIETFVEERVSDAEKLRGGIAFVASLPKTPSGKNITMEVKDMFQKYLVVSAKK